MKVSPKAIEECFTNSYVCLYKVLQLIKKGPTRFAAMEPAAIPLVRGNDPSLYYKLLERSSRYSQGHCSNMLKYLYVGHKAEMDKHASLMVSLIEEVKGVLGDIGAIKESLDLIVGSYTERSPGLTQMRQVSSLFDGLKDILSALSTSHASFNAFLESTDSAEFLNLNLKARDDEALLKRLCESNCNSFKQYSERLLSRFAEILVEFRKRTMVSGVFCGLFNSARSDIFRKLEDIIFSDIDGYNKMDLADVGKTVALLNRVKTSQCHMGLIYYLYNVRDQLTKWESDYRNKICVDISTGACNLAAVDLIKFLTEFNLLATDHVITRSIATRQSKPLSSRGA